MSGKESVRYSYETTKFLFRSDWALFLPAAGLNAEACNTRRLLKHGSKGKIMPIWRGGLPYMIYALLFQ